MKIVTFSFDDCEIHDRRLAMLLRQYGMKATFFLISGQLGLSVPFHRYGEDTTVERVTAEEIPITYRGMEVASHTQFHQLPLEATRLREEMTASLQTLSDACGYRVCGMAYPGGQYVETQTEALRQMRLMYARGASPTHTLSVPCDYLRWQPSCHYADEHLPALIHRFLQEEGDLLLHIFGHSYELTQRDSRKNWCAFEETLKVLAGRDDIQYCTNAETVMHFTKGLSDR
ncbi:MAG: polysaccharide deacetylase family protein [Clostridia bacterium]